MTQQKNTRGQLKAAAILMIFGLSFALFIQSAAAEMRDTIIASFKGEVEVRQGQTAAWQKAEKGLVIQPGDVVRTGTKSWAMIRHDSAKIQLFENTLLEFPYEQSSPRISETQNSLVTVVLQKGHSIFKVFKNLLKRRFEVISPSLIAGVKGTVFEVFEKDSFQGVAVSEGVVEVVNLDFRNEIIEVKANQYTEIRDMHLTLPKEHQGEDLLREENRQVEDVLKAEGLGNETTPQIAEAEAPSAIEDERKDLAADLKDERKDLDIALRNEKKELEDLLNKAK